MIKNIFYSWQNDLDGKTHRYFIEKCIKKALKDLGKDALIYMDYDRDTMGLNGSPDITSSIFDKIDKSVLFICDVSIVNSDYSGRKTPNPNVLIELGYAANKLGWDRIICLFDTSTGEIESLPFDLRQKRVTSFSPNTQNELERISGILLTNIKNLYSKGKLFNPLNDYIKGKIDHSILAILKPMSNIVFGTLSLSEGMAQIDNLLNYSCDEIKKRIGDAKFPGYLVFNDFSVEADELKDILKDLFSSSYFPKEWSYTVLEVLDWIRMYSWFVSKRNKEYPFEKDSFEYNDLAAINAHHMNPDNPKSSYLILETRDSNGTRYVATEGGKVINVTHFPTDNLKIFTQSFRLNDAGAINLANKIYSLIVICREWLNTTDGEFILDPDYYVIS